MIADRRTFWEVSQTREEGCPPTAPIPTVGHATSASDLYRVTGILATGHEGWNSCYVDVATCQAIARLVEGPITSFNDLAEAETALQALLWHDRVDILIPGAKVLYEDALVEGGRLHMYKRFDQTRTPLCFDIFAACQSQDCIYATELLTVRDQKVRKSSIKRSPSVGKKVETPYFKDNGYLRNNLVQAATLAAVPSYMGVPAYFSDQSLSKFFGNRGFFEKFYKTMQASWDESSSETPILARTVAFPPLVAILLDRTKTRHDLPQSIESLREELSECRAELLGLNEMLRGPFKQAEIEDRCRYYEKAFEATFAASRISPTERRARFLYRAYRATRKLRRPLKWLFEEIINPDFQDLEPSTLVDRTITSKTFARLLDIESMYCLSKQFLSETEIRNIDQSLRA